MGMEIDFIAVGDKSKGGDAIAIRFGNLFGSRDDQVVMIVDGGTKESGRNLVAHVREHYGTDRVDYVVSTHPDGDHISGLTEVLEGLDVGEIWMNRPVNHSVILETYVKAGLRESLPQWLRESIQQADDFESLANKMGIPIREAFFDGFPNFSSQDYEVMVLGPSELYYNELVEEMRKEEEDSASPEGAFSAAFNYARSAATGVLEYVGKETLTDEGKTSPSNNSSVVLLIRAPDGDALLTGDAGIPALEYVLKHAESLGIDLSHCEFQQVPHHGSKRNIGPTLLDTLIGPRGGTQSGISVCVSAPKEGRPKHPSFKVTNAYKRRGARVFTTEGSNFCRSIGVTPDRDGYSSATPLGYGPEEDE